MKELYTSIELERVAGVTKRQLNYWTTSGVIRASRRHRYGEFNLYKRGEALKTMLLGALVGKGRRGDGRSGRLFLYGSVAEMSAKPLERFDYLLTNYRGERYFDTKAQVIEAMKDLACGVRLVDLAELRARLPQ